MTSPIPNPNDLDIDFGAVDFSQIAENKEQNEEIPNISEDALSQIQILKQNGYSKVDNITDTLQGSVFMAIERDSAQTVVIKRTSKALHKRRVTIQNGAKYAVNEDIMREYSILRKFAAAKKSPAQITKMLNFFESRHNYFMVMEHSGGDFFDFILKAHEFVADGTLKIKEWRKFVKYLFYQLVVAVQWLHNTMNCTYDL